MSGKQPKVRVMLQLTPQEAKFLRLSAVSSDMTVSAYVAWMLQKANLPTCKTPLGTPTPGSECSPLYSGYGLVSKDIVPDFKLGPAPLEKGSQPSSEIEFRGVKIITDVPCNVPAQAAEPPTSPVLSAVDCATSPDQAAGSLVTVKDGAVTGVESAFVQSGPLTKPDAGSSSESPSTSPTDSSES